MSSCTAPTPSVGESRTIADAELTVEGRQALLRLARAGLEAHVRGAPPPAPPLRGVFALRRGAFVSLHANGALRGCIGHIPADRPLGEVVLRMVVAAGRDDARFSPVTADELPDLHLEISVLSQPVTLAPVDAGRVVIGRDGLIVRRGDTLGLLLPQVALEHGWAAEVFLAEACCKAGLAADAWRAPGTEVLVFQADVFGE